MPAFARLRTMAFVAGVLQLAGCALLGIGPTTLLEDTPYTTPSGAGFKAPGGGWIAEQRGRYVLLTAPEGDFRMAVVDVDSSDAGTVVAQAWKIAGFGKDRPVGARLPRPARDGWEEIFVLIYDVPPNEHAFQQAAAYRRGSAWAVVLVEGALATLEKRNSQAIVVLETLKPRDYRPETFAGRQAHPLDEERLARLREFIHAAQEKLDIPGVAVSIVQDGRVVLEEGFGVRVLGQSQRVTADTRFMIGSNNKALSTLLLAKLQDQRRLQWDTPVVSLYPGFRLGNAETTRSVQVQHLVCACTGMPRQDLEWGFEFEKATPESVVRGLADSQPTSDFGEVYQYSNPMAAMAGYLGAHLLFPEMELGSAYDRAMQEQVFDPLGMKRATFDFRKALAGDHAGPHAPGLDNRARPVDLALHRSITPVRPAGGAWASVHDVRKYIQMELATGVLPDGTRYISEASLLARRTPYVRVSNNVSYAMGLMLNNRWGVPVVHHGGDAFGFMSDMMFLPEHGVGAVILTNSSTGLSLLAAFQRKLLEVLFDGEDRAASDVAATADAQATLIAHLREKTAVPADPARSAMLAGRYSNEALGTIEVIRKRKRLYFDFGGFASEVGTQENEDGTFSYVLLAPGLDWFPFVAMDQDHGKRGLVARDGQHEYLFLEY